MMERETITACLTGEGEEFRLIVNNYQSQVMALAVNILGNREDAEDACQETFVQVFRHLSAYDPARNFRTWIFTILYRRCLDSIRRKRRFRNFVRRAQGEPSQSMVTPPADPPGGGIAGEEIIRLLRPKERTALTLWANEGLTAAEIGAVIECAPSTARVYLFNARRKLKALMEERKNHGPLGVR